MDAELKRKWVEALRSGNYHQTTGALHRAGGGYCCLGVLCEVMGEKNWKDAGSTPGEFNKLMLMPYMEKTGLPRELHVRSGIPLGTQTVLVGMNDTYRNNFNEIADYIEENL
jgi:hypothetical protein